MDINLFTQKEFNVDVLRELTEAQLLHNHRLTYEPELFGPQSLDKILFMDQSQTHINKIIKQLDLTFLN